jgi:hypothetical protein
MLRGFASSFHGRREHFAALNRLASRHTTPANAVPEVAATAFEIEKDFKTNTGIRNRGSAARA